MSTLFINLIKGDITPKECREKVSDTIIDYLTDISYIEDLDAVPRGKKIKLVRKRLLELVTEIEGMPDAAAAS